MTKPKFFVCLAISILSPIRTASIFCMTRDIHNKVDLDESFVVWIPNGGLFSVNTFLNH